MHSTRTTLMLVASAICLGVLWGWYWKRTHSTDTTPSASAQERGSREWLAHNVYFSLKENTPEARARLVQACHKYLSGHEGTVFFAVGVLADDLNRPVNDRDFDVALHIVFRDKSAHDRYQEHPRHKQFIEENQASWKKGRVFDSYVTTRPSD